MSHFSVTVLRIDSILAHTNADALELAVIGGFRCVVPKDKYHAGDLVAYIPEGSMLPKALVTEMGLDGRLAGPDSNRVKAVRLRGELSQGLVYAARPNWNVSQNVAEELGITKYEPVLPAQLKGVLQNVSGHRTISYDIENWRKFPHVLKDGEKVVFTEKLHGTWVQFGVMPESLRLEDGTRFVVASKGLAQRGLAFQSLAEDNKHNLYLVMARRLSIQNRIEREFCHELLEGNPVFVLGEIFGQGVQDLGYGSDRRSFRVFDIYVGVPGRGRFLSDDELENAVLSLDNCNVDEGTRDNMIERVPVLYRGPFSIDTMQKFTDGLETVSGKNQHIREGIVMRSAVEREEPADPIHGELPCSRRVQLKSVSAAYLLRKGDTTEYQ